MKSKLLFILLITTLFLGCKQDLSQVEPIKKYKTLIKGASPYIDWYLKDDESIITYSFTEYPYKKEYPHLIFERNTEDNTISLKNNESIRIHDAYSLDSIDRGVTLHLTREVTFMEQTNSYNLDVDITDTTAVLPILITRPNRDDCNCIPMCYYDSMEVEWNADPDNYNGVVIIAEWSGITMTGGVNNNTHIAIMDIVDDTGVATLNNAIFEGMPDEALVNLWFIRGNVIELHYHGEITLPDFLDMASEDPEAARDFLEENPEFLLELQTMSIGHGSVALQSIYLIRTINSL